MQSPFLYAEVLMKILDELCTETYPLSSNALVAISDSRNY